MAHGLISFKKAEQHLKHRDLLEWQSRAVQDIREHILRKDYPCVFTRSGYDKDHLMMCFIQDPFRPSDIAKGFDAIRDFVQVVDKAPNQQAAALKTLMLCVDCSKLDETKQEQAVWALLNGFLALDKSLWPANIPSDPDDPDWAYCLFGKRAFITALAPSHKVRHSRNIGSHMVLLYQLRDGIEHVAPYNSKGDDVREIIRKRIEAYDDVPLAPDMTTHGEGGNKDWTQYWLGDGMGRFQGKCPLHHKT
ncbi:YqcI/YcgG family protein [Pseudomonas alloputida]|uniref:YqcI/YcgG family protein n=1 Tax=Pseudomonas TaxID=286 RepID=UPI003EE8DB2A